MRVLNIGQENLEIIIQDCYNAGNISGDGKNCYLGGVASLTVYTNINRCYNTGNITATGNTAMIGGIVSDGYNGKIMNGYNIGTISGVDAIQGGLVGQGGDSIKIYNSYNAGIVNGSSRYYVAGLGGCIVGGTDVNNCFNFGSVTGQAELFYDITNATVQNLYYISRGLPAIVDGTPTEEPIAKTLAEFNSQAFVDELNENIKDMPECVKWKLGSNGYPVLDM